MARNLFQFGMRQRFLAECPASPSNKQIIEAAVSAGYSRVKAGQKIPKFKAWLAERDGAIRIDENPANRRSLISGKKLPHWLGSELQAEQPGEASPHLKESLVAPSEDDWWRDPTDGRYQKLFFDHEGHLKSEEDSGRRAYSIPSFSNSYVSRYRGLDGELHLVGERLTRPVWSEPDLRELFRELKDDPLGDPDALTQADLARDDSLSQKIISQMAKGTH